MFLDDEHLKPEIKNFEQYIELYISSSAEEASDTSGGAAQVKRTVIYEQVHPRWEIAFTISDDLFQRVPFANPIATTKGGMHVNCITDNIAKSLITSIPRRNKGTTAKPAQIRNHVWIFVHA